MTRVAQGSFVVALKPQALEGIDASALLARLSIDKQISGDLQATTQGSMLSAGTAVKGSAAYVALERVTGTLHGKSGSFALMHVGTMNRGTPSLSITVVPDSGTGELEGLQGDFKLQIVDGKHLYELSYSLPG